MLDLSQNIKVIRDAMTDMTRTNERTLLLTAFGPNADGGRCDRLKKLFSQMHGCGHPSPDVAGVIDKTQKPFATFFLTYSLASQMMKVITSTHAWSTIKNAIDDTHVAPMVASFHPSPQLKERTISDYYDLGDTEIGKGGFGSVYVGKHKTSGAKCAIKAVAKDGASVAESVTAEIEIHGSLVHPNIVRLFDSFQHAEKCFLVMEFCSGGELFDRILAARQAPDSDGRAVNEIQAANYMKQIAEGMAYLHSVNVAHRDMKPENFLLLDEAKDAHVKIIDFGLAKRFHDGVPMETRLGTVNFMAPEVVQGSYNEKCDVWSCGVVAFALLSGEVPFYGNTDCEILLNVMKGFVDFPSWMECEISAPGLDFIEGMLTMDPLGRPSFNATCSHKWLTDHSYKRCY